MGRNIILIIFAVLLIMVGRPAMAMPASPDVTVFFNVTKPDMSIITKLTDLSGGNSTSASAEFTAAGTGHTSGAIEGAINQTGWTWLTGTYFGSELDLSSTFQVDALRTNSSDLNSTFATNQSIAATGVGPLEFTIIGAAAASSFTDTWDLGLRQEFWGTTQSVSGTANNQFEQRDNSDSLVGNPINNQFTVTATERDSFIGSSEGGSYKTVLDKQSQPGFGFGFAASMFSLDVQDSSGPINLDVLMSTDQIEGETTTTWRDYLNNPNP